MKLIIIALLSISSFASIARNVTYIVKPLVEVSSVEMGNTTYSGTINTSGNFAMTFFSIDDCSNWVKKSVDALESKKMTIYSAYCEEGYDFDSGDPDGSFTGNVEYL